MRSTAVSPTTPLTTSTPRKQSDTHYTDIRDGGGVYRCGSRAFLLISRPVLLCVVCDASDRRPVLDEAQHTVLYSTYLVVLLLKFVTFSIKFVKVIIKITKMLLVSSIE